MATNYTSLLGFALPTTGELDGTWGETVNNSITELVEDAIAATASADVTSANWTLTTAGGGGVNQARCAILIPTGTPGVSRNIIAPSQSKAYIVINQSNAAVVLKGSVTTGVTIPSGTKMLVAWNGSDFVQIGESVVVTTFSGGTTGLTPSTGTSGAVTLAGTLNAANGGTGRSTLTSGAILLGNGTGQVGQLSGSSVGQVPQWNGTTWSVGSLPSGGVTNVTASAPIASSGGSTPNISLTGTVPVANGGTGQTSTPSSGQLLIGTGSGYVLNTITGGTGIDIVNGSGTITISATGTAGVSTFSGGTTGLTPATATTGAITLSGTLATTNGGTGLAGFGAANKAIYSTSASVLVADTLPTAAGGTGLTAFGAANRAIYSTSTSALTAGTLPTAAGGTGLTAFTANKAVYATSTSALTTGTLPTAAGGTNLASFTSGGAMYATSTSALTTGTLPVASGGTGVTAQPKFFARSASTQTVTSAVFTKVTLGTEAFDTNSNFASSRFTPTVAGYYQINGCVRANPGVNSTENVIICSIYRNGSEYIRGNEITASNDNFQQAVASGIIYFNGSTDYVELYGYVFTNTGTPSFYYDSAILGSYMSGAFIGA